MAFVDVIAPALIGPLVGSLFGGSDAPAAPPPRPQQMAQPAPQQQQQQGGNNNNNMGVMGLIGQASGGIRGANAAHNAAGVLSDASDSATNQQTAFYNQNRGDLSPYMQNGNVALNSMMGKFADGSLGGQFTGADYLANKDPGYDFQLQQGNQALQNSQAAHDGVMSGAAMKGMIDYNQGMASTGYQNAYQRWLSTQQNSFGQLSDVAGMGAQSAGHLASVGQGYSKNIADSVTASGNAKASGIMGYANAMNNGVQGLSQAGDMMGMSSLLRGAGNGIGNGMRNMFRSDAGELGMPMGGDQQGGAGGSMGQGGDYGLVQQQDPWANPYSNEGNNYQQQNSSSQYQDPNAQYQDPSMAGKSYDPNAFNPAYYNS